MSPSVRAGDELVVRPVTGSDMEIGDILLFRRQGAEELVAHRLVQRAASPEGAPSLGMTGDRDPLNVEWVSENQVLGRVELLKRRSRLLSRADLKKQSGWRSTLLPVTLFISWRLCHLLALHPFYYYVTDEELFRGMIGKEILKGLSFPFLDYRADNYSGGSLVVGAITSVFFRLFGPTAFALKLTPLALFAGALAFWHRTVRRYAGSRAALYFGLIFIFSPPAFTLYSLAAMGYHSETIFFTAVSVYLAFEIMSRPKASRFYDIALGLTAGFALWFSYIYGVTLMALGLYTLGRRSPLPTWGRLARMGTAFLVGFSPWIWIHVFHHVDGLYFGSLRPWDFLSWRRFIGGFMHWGTSGLVRLESSFSPEDWLLQRRHRFDALYAFLFAVPILIDLIISSVRFSFPRPAMRGEAGGEGGGRGDRRNIPRLDLVAACYLLLFVIILQAALDGFQYHLPALPFLFVLTAISITRLEAGSPPRLKKFPRGKLLCIVMLGVYSSLSMFSWRFAGRMSRDRGYSYVYIPAPFQTYIPSCLNYYHRLLPTLASQDQVVLANQVAAYVAPLIPWGPNGVSLSRSWDSESTLFKERLCFFLGAEIPGHFPSSTPEALLQALNELRPLSSHYLQTASLGYFYALDAAPESSLASFEGLAGVPKKLPQEVSDSYWRSLGYRHAWHWHQMDTALPKLKEQLVGSHQSLPEEAHAPFTEGVGEYISHQWNETLPECVLWTGRAGANAAR